MSESVGELQQIVSFMVNENGIVPVRGADRNSGIESD
jgi:hypothetical protein